MSVLKQQCLPEFFICLAKNMADYNVNCNSVVVVVFFLSGIIVPSVRI